MYNECGGVRKIFPNAAALATGDCVRTRQNAAIFAPFVKFSLEVRIVRLRSPLPKIICDFLIFNKLNKEIEIVVEVDGSQHKEEAQAARDRRKDRLLKATGIKILRLSTTTIECKEKIIAVLTKTDVDSKIPQEKAV